MVNQTFYNLGTAPSVIRQLFAYGLEQAKLVGPENVFDYSLGNPSIPAPKKVNASIHKIVDETDSIHLHGYSMAPGFEEPRQAIADDLSCRFGLPVKASELFLTCGAAPAAGWWWFPPTPTPSRCSWTRWSSASPLTPRPSLSTPRIIPPAWSIPRRLSGVWPPS